MRKIIPMMLAASSLGTAAMAGGVDRSGQGIGYLFETGNYTELSFGSLRPTVKTAGDVFGNVAQDYTTMSLGLKFDLSDKLSFGLGIDNPYGADVEYGGSFPIPFGAELKSTSITALGRYKFSPNMSVHGGIYQTSIEGSYTRVVTTNIAKSTDNGYIIGAAYERPEIAARVALTYFSGTDHVDPSSNSSFNAPQAVNLDFQTGIAANTLLFGSVRWADWSETVINVNNADIVSYDQDSVTYNLGVGHKFSDSFSGAISVGYEQPQGSISSALAPTDGYLSLGLGATYTHENMKITAGVRRIQLGNATTEGLPVNTWEGNSALAAGIKISFSF